MNTEGVDESEGFRAFAEKECLRRMSKIFEGIQLRTRNSKSGRGYAEA